ncbi:MAG: DUF2480 family protein [Cytophagales bacterium]
MDNSEEILNKVATSGLVVIDLGDWYDQRKRIQIDLKDYLWQGIALKEKDFREHLKNLDLNQFKDTLVAVQCSEDAIIPMWAYMLVVAKLQPVAAKVVFGTLEDIDNFLFEELLNSLDLETYRDKKVVIKGCGKYPIGPHVYMKLTSLLQPLVSSIMFGEPCSTVPVYKNQVKK